jgi:uncharacterized protein (DUF1786 family)
MGLFENQRKASLVSSVELVEDVLAELGHDPARARRADRPPSWRFEHGSASVRVSLLERAQFVQLRVVAPVMRLDAAVDRLALFSRLLLLHVDAVHAAAFALDRDEVQLVAERSTIDLDRSEVRDIIGRIRDFADTYDNALIAEFGGHQP